MYDKKLTNLVRTWGSEAASILSTFSSRFASGVSNTEEHSFIEEMFIKFIDMSLLFAFFLERENSWTWLLKSKFHAERSG